MQRVHCLLSASKQAILTPWVCSFVCVFPEYLSNIVLVVVYQVNPRGNKPERTLHMSPMRSYFQESKISLF